jgi:hypothetical protein
MHPFEQHLLSRIQPSLESWQGQNFTSDIYAIYLMLRFTENSVKEADIDNLIYLTNSHTTPELADSHGSRFSPGCAAGNPEVALPNDVEGQKLRETYIREHAAPFTLEKYETDLVSKHGRLQLKANQSPDEMTRQDWLDLASLTCRFDPEGKYTQELSQNNRLIACLYDEKVLGAFLGACEAVIAELHQSGLIEKVCGKPVPVGIAFSNDFCSDAVLTYTNKSYPDALSAVWVESWPKLSQ